MNVPSNQDLIDFLLHEVRLLDDQRYDDWLQLFADDGYYWMPLERGQTDPKLVCSLLYEDTLLLKVRIERLHGRRTFSQQPGSRSHHLLQWPSVESRDEAAGTESIVVVAETTMELLKSMLDERDTVIGRLVERGMKPLFEPPTAPIPVESDKSDVLDDLLNKGTKFLALANGFRSLRPDSE